MRNWLLRVLLLFVVVRTCMGRAQNVSGSRIDDASFHCVRLAEHARPKAFRTITGTVDAAPKPMPTVPADTIHSLCPVHLRARREIDSSGNLDP